MKLKTDLNENTESECGGEGWNAQVVGHNLDTHALVLYKMQQS
jgi:hypothetical protein